MSQEISGDSVIVDIDIVDVDALDQECIPKSGSNSDSGLDVGELSSTTQTVLSDFEISPLKYLQNSTYDREKNNNLKNPGNESEGTPPSISPTEVIEMSRPDFPTLLSETPNMESILIKHSGDEIGNDDCKCVDKCVDTQSIPSNLDSNAQPLNSTDVVPKYAESELESATKRTLTNSTFSLNDASLCLDNSIMCKSPYSKSAENISNLEEPKDTKELNSSSKNLDAVQILSEFSNQKTKVSATQKITPENLQANNENKQSRLPKEILSQDLGSIVKNVHGIFWSVSGNLKNAYTQRVYAQKAPIKNPKPIVNGKVMSEIFEDAIDVQPTISDGSICTEKIANELNSFNPTEPKTSNINGDGKTDTMNVSKLQVESLEKILFEQRKENAMLRERIKQQSDELQAKDQTFKDLETKLDLMNRRVEQAQKDANAAVMKYAGAECAAIEGKKAAEAAKRAQQAAVSECELLAGKLKSAHTEKQRICQLYDDKCHELQNSEREAGKLRDDLKELEGRLKWTQSKLRMEMDAYKESSERAEKLGQQVTELEAAKEAAVVGASDSARAKVLEAELKESQAALILCRHEKVELERRLSSTSQQLETCRRERDEASVALSSASDEVERLKAHNLRLEEEAAELAALRAQAALADTLSSQLQRETERASRAEEALGAERARAETCARREAAALEHSARLTAQHVAQRAQTGEHEAKAQALAADNACLRERAESLQKEVVQLRASLAEETERRHRENRVLARKVAELTEEVAETNKRLEWEKGENGVLKKKHSSAIKELNRELQRALKRSEQLEAKLQQCNSTSIRTGSVTSLSSGEGGPSDERVSNGVSDDVPDVQGREPGRQALIERIVSLQRAAARRSERCEFLEEHSRQLTAELRGKAKLLRHLLAAQPAGAVAPPRSDANKKEIAKLGGGAMAAVWGGDPGGMTLDLSLEMNKRLQALLEDTLLKNITLKENIDTLGEEIARLKTEKNTSTDNK